MLCRLSNNTVKHSETNAGVIVVMPAEHNVSVLTVTNIGLNRLMSWSSCGQKRRIRITNLYTKSMQDCLTVSSVIYNSWCHLKYQHFNALKTGLPLKSNSTLCSWGPHVGQAGMHSRLVHANYVDMAWTPKMV